VQRAGKQLLKQAIVPHAPYSVSASLFKLIDGHQQGAVISIHNQESEEENKYYQTKGGTVGELLQVLGIDDSLFQPTGKPSLESYLQWLSPGHPYIFVHNTSSTRDDVRHAQGFANEVYWCLCPNANLYIEHRLPDIDMLIGEGVNICIGTDSLASNHQLSVLSELQTIKKHFPHISWETLLNWGTANGARALQLQDVVGAIEVGKKPGVLWLQGIEGDEVSVQRIV
jgi:cytosine/adenosine deaminase-related metal-dependent hydrolase